MAFHFLLLWAQLIKKNEYFSTNFPCFHCSVLNTQLQEKLFVYIINLNAK